MHKTIFLLAFLLPVFGAFSQQYEKCTYISDFNDKGQTYWTEGVTGDYSKKIISGNYVIKNFSTSTWYFWNYYNFLNSKDFSIELKIKGIGTEDNYYGLILNVVDQNSYVGFFISNDGYFAVKIYKNDESVYNYEHKSSYIKTGGNVYNILKVKKVRNTYNFYINGHLVKVVSGSYLYGEDVGFMVPDNFEVWIDYLKIEGYRKKISIVSNPISKQKINLGPNVNTQYTELLPVISADGSYLFFVREDDPRNVGSENKQDVWYSKKAGDGWSPAKNIGRPVNTPSPDGVFFISADNNTIYISHNYDAWGNHSGEGIAVSHRQKDGTWSVPENVKIDNYYNYNDYKNFTLSADQQILIISAERDDSYGGLDLYVSFRKPDGTFSEPKNLGPVVNSKKDDFSPFLAPDGVTLYFASEGHPGYGSSDIFMTKRLDNTWKHWSKPKNLGPYINTSDWDAYFSVDAEGEYAYLVSTNNSYGNEDIFMIKLKEEDKPEPVVIVYGNVYNKKTGKPLGTKISYTDLRTKKNIATAISNPKTGEYKIVLPYGTKYSFYAKKTGFFPVSDFIDLRKISGYKEIRRDLYLTPIEKDEIYVLHNVFFERGKADLLPDSYEELDRVVKLMKQNPEIKIEVSGHTNNIGDMVKLMDLSRRRAEAVKQYLVHHGIAASRIKTVGYGPKKPIASNDTPEGRKKNQRVEFKIIEK